MKKIAVVIANRNEPDLPNTIDSIKASCPEALPVVIHDDAGLGPQQCRHRGIMNEAHGADVIVVTDGHMRFRPGVFDELAAYVRRRPNHIAGTKCYHNEAIEFEGRPYASARIDWKTENPGKRFHTLDPKWRETDRADGKVGCLMGACYAFAREWYADGLGQPWQWGTGWGGDEQLLSIVTWLHGGESVQLDLEVAHQNRGGGAAPFSYSEQQFAGVWANHLRLLNLLPMTAWEREELSTHIGKNRWNAHSAKLIDQELNRYGSVANYRDRLAKQKRTFAEWRLTWEGRETENKVTVADLRRELKELGVNQRRDMKRGELARLLVDATRAPKPSADAPAVVAPTVETRPRTPQAAKVRPQIIQQKIIRCDRCDTVDPFRASAGKRQAGRHLIQYGRCRRCGHKMQKRLSRV